MYCPCSARLPSEERRDVLPLADSDSPHVVGNVATVGFPMLGDSWPRVLSLMVIQSVLVIVVA